MSFLRKSRNRRAKFIPAGVVCAVPVWWWAKLKLGEWCQENKDPTFSAHLLSWNSMSCHAPTPDLRSGPGHCTGGTASGRAVNSGDLVAVGRMRHVLSPSKQRV